MVSDRPRDIRVQAQAEHPRHRRCLHRRRDAEVRLCREFPSQGLRGGRRQTVGRRDAGHAEADQHLLQPDCTQLRHYRRRRLSAG